jgi:beta-lactamase class C
MAIMQKGHEARIPNEGLLGAAWAMKSTISDMAKYLKVMLMVNNRDTSLIKATEMAQTGYIKLVTQNQYANLVGLAWSIIPLYNINERSLLANSAYHPIIRIDSIKSPNYTSNVLVEKTGSTDGFRSYMGFIPSQKIGVVILTNRFFNISHSQWSKFGRSFLIGKY